MNQTKESQLLQLKLIADYPESDRLVTQLAWGKLNSKLDPAWRNSSETTKTRKTQEKFQRRAEERPSTSLIFLENIAKQNTFQEFVADRENWRKMINKQAQIFQKNWENNKVKKSNAKN